MSERGVPGMSKTTLAYYWGYRWPVVIVADHESPGPSSCRFEADEIHAVRTAVHAVLQAEWDLRYRALAVQMSVPACMHGRCLVPSHVRAARARLCLGLQNMALAPPERAPPPTAQVGLRPMQRTLRHNVYTYAGTWSTPRGRWPRRQRS